MTELLHASEEGIAAAAQALSQGKLVGFPTETVFGLGALVTVPQAVEGIFIAKGRPVNHPLIAHVSKGFDLSDWADLSSPDAQSLIKNFWPGPLTLVVPRGPKMPLSVTGGQDSVGIRCPSHPVAQKLLALLNAPVAAPSANRFGKVSPTASQHVLDELNGRIDFVLDGDSSSVGIESTIVSLLGGQVVLLRPGSVTRDQIEKVLGCKVHLPDEALYDQGLRVSGNLEQHYCPDASLYLCDEVADPALLNVVSSGKVLVVGWTKAFLTQFEKCDVLDLPDDPQAVAQRLYSILRNADKQGVEKIIFQRPPINECWRGVTDRLQRAAFRS